MNTLHRIERFLDERMIPFDLIAHTQTNLATSHSAHVQPGHMARACCSKETKHLWDLFGDAPHCHFCQTRVHH